MTAAADLRLRLSVLDQSPVVSGRPEDASLRDTLALAERCDTLGYHRFWVSEHHGHPSIAGTAPEVLMAAIAVRTARIRVGSAGIMLPHYPAFKVAEQFRVLEALAPGRIDLGLGRAPGSDFRTAQLLNPDARHAAERFPQQVLELQAWLQGAEMPRAARAAASSRTRAAPACPRCGCSAAPTTARKLAAHLGWPYAFAYFFSDGQGADSAMRLYRELFEPGERGAKPEATLCVFALAADTEEAAWHAYASRERWRADRLRNRLGPLPSPEEALARPLDADERRQAEAARADAAVGTAAQVGARLRALAARFGLAELVVTTWAHDPAVRLRSFELLAAEFGLAAQA